MTLVAEYFRTMNAHQAVQTQLLRQLLAQPRQQMVRVGDLVPLDVIRHAHIQHILATTATREEAAEILGVNPATLYRNGYRRERATAGEVANG